MRMRMIVVMMMMMMMMMAWHEHPRGSKRIQEDSRRFKKIQLEPEPLITERMGLAAKNDFCRPQGRNLTVTITSTDSTC